MGSVEYRTAGPEVKTTPEGAFSMVAIRVLPPNVNVAVVPSIDTDALVCIRHSAVRLVLVKSSCSRTCLRPLSRRIPRLTELFNTWQGAVSTTEQTLGVQDDETHVPK